MLSLTTLSVVKIIQRRCQERIKVLWSLKLLQFFGGGWGEVLF